MTAKDISEMLHREPVEPFRVVTSSGESYTVCDPERVAMMDRRLFVALPKDRWTFVPCIHVSAIDAVAVCARALD